MGQRIERPSILVIQARLEPQDEQARMAPFAQQAGVWLRYVNPLQDNPEDWTRQSFLTEGHRGVIVLGSSDIDHAVDTPRMRQFDRLAMPVIKNVMEGDLPALGECFGDQAMAKAIRGTVVRDESRQEAGTGMLHLTPEGQEHPIFQNLPEYPVPITLGHKDSVELPQEDVVLLGTTDLDPFSVWVYGGNKIGFQGHPSIQDGKAAEAAFNSVSDPRLGRYKQTYPFIDTPHSGLMLVNFMAGAATGQLRSSEMAA